MAITQTPEEAELIKYLLGEMPETERQAVEERCFEDSDFFYALTDLENDLADKYVTGKLTDVEQLRYEQSFAKFPARRAEVAQARLLQRHIKEQKTAVEPVIVDAPVVRPKPVRQSVGAWLAGLFNFQTPAWQYAMAGLLFFLTAGGAWLLYDGYQLRQQLARTQNNQEDLRRLEQELAQSKQNARDLEQQQADLQRQVAAAKDKNEETAAALKESEAKIQQAKQEIQQREREIERLQQLKGSDNLPGQLVAQLEPLGASKGGDAVCSAAIKPGAQNAVVTCSLPDGVNEASYRISLNGKEYRRLNAPARRALVFTLPARNLTFAVDGVREDGTTPNLGTYRLTVRKKK